MNVVSRPAESFGQPSDLQPDEVSQYAPRWARDERARSRNVVPIRLPEAPQLGDRLPDRSHPRNLDAFEGDATLRKLLQSPSLDPDMVPEPPTRDSIGLALGMIARLMVAGCAAAAVALLLVGAIPLPFKGTAPTSETTATASKAWPAAPERVAKMSSRIGEEQVAASGDPAGPALASVATQTVRAPQPVASEPRVLDPEEIARLTRRGEEFLAQGDIAAARLILTRAAEAQDGRAALALAASYDPAVLKELGVLGFRPDVARARTWYEKAAQYGSAEASRRLTTLPLM